MGDARESSDAPRRDPVHDDLSEVEPEAELEVELEVEVEGEAELEPEVEPEVEPVIEGEGEAAPFDAGVDAASMIEHARRQHGLAGGLLAAGMFGVDQALTGRKVREEAPIVIAANSDPIDVDTDGITVPLDDEAGLSVVAPPQPRTPPHTKPSGSRRRWR